MTSINGITARGDDVGPSRRRDEAAPSDPMRVAFALNANQNMIFWRIVALRHANPNMPIRAADLEGAGTGASTITKALAELTGKAPGEPGKLVRSVAGGYMPEVDPLAYVLRDLQFAAGCKPNPSSEVEPAIDPANEPGDPLAAVKAYEIAARVSLRAKKWEEQTMHGFHFARRNATKGELKETMEWIVANWKAVLRGRDFAHLWEDEDDAAGFCVRRRSRRPASPEPQFIGGNAHLFWNAWDRHVKQERARAEADAKSLKEAQARATQDAKDAKAADEAGLTVEVLRQQRVEARERESRRQLEENRARNPELRRLMALAALRAQETTLQDKTPTLPPTPEPLTAVMPETPRALGPDQPRWEDEMKPFPIISIPTWEELYPTWTAGEADQSERGEG